jgi:hypothetical protein
MGYSLDDFFDEHILPKLKALISDGSPDKFEKFIDIIRNSSGTRRSEDFFGWLIDASANPSCEQMSTHLFIQTIFNYVRDNVELLSIEYKEDGAQVSVDYRKEQETSCRKENDCED